MYVIDNLALGSDNLDHEQSGYAIGDGPMRVKFPTPLMGRIYHYGWPIDVDVRSRNQGLDQSP